MNTCIGRSKRKPVVIVTENVFSLAMAVQKCFFTRLIQSDSCKLVKSDREVTHMCSSDDENMFVSILRLIYGSIA